MYINYAILSLIKINGGWDMEKGRNSFEVLCKTLNENTPQPKENNLDYVGEYWESMKM